jgi:hypothetical protein
MRIQQDEEILGIFDEYLRGDYIAKDLIVDGEIGTANGRMLLDYIQTKFGIVSVSNIRKAEEELGDKLSRTKAPTEAELAARFTEIERLKIAKATADNHTLVQEKRGQAHIDKSKKDAIARELKTTIDSIDQTISSHVKGHPSGFPDYAHTEAEQNILREVRDRYEYKKNLVHANYCLTAVRLAKSKLN